MRSTTAVQAKSGDPRTPNREYRLGTWRKGLSGTAAAVFALMVLAGCSLSTPGGKSSNQVCADKIAQASVSGAVPGLWKCLDATFQTTLHSYGNDGDGALIKTPFALSAHFMGCTSDVCTYELTLKPDVAAQAGVKTVVLAVWIDSDGRVSNVGIPSPIY